MFLGAFSASESVSEFLDAVLSFFTAVCVQFLLFEIIIVARPPRPRKKKVIIIGCPPLRRKKVIIIQHHPAPLTGSGSYFCLSGRFRDLVLPLISSTAAFFVSWSKNGRFPRILEGDFNSRPKGRQMPEICLQKAPGQDLAKNGRFPMIPEEKCNSRLKGRQMAEICLPKAARSFRKLPKASRRLSEGSQKVPTSSQKALRRLSEGSQKVPEASEGSQVLPEGYRKLPEAPRKLLEAPRKFPESCHEGSQKLSEGS